MFLILSTYPSSMVLQALRNFFLTKEMAHVPFYCLYKCGLQGIFITTSYNKYTNKFQHFFNISFQMDIEGKLSAKCCPNPAASNYIQFCFYFLELSTTAKTLHFQESFVCPRKMFSRKQLQNVNIAKIDNCIKKKTMVLICT